MIGITAAINFGAHSPGSYPQLASSELGARMDEWCDQQDFVPSSELGSGQANLFRIINEQSETHHYLTPITSFSKAKETLFTEIYGERKKNIREIISVMINGRGALLLETGALLKI